MELLTNNYRIITMVETWEFQKGPDERCDNCGAVYSVTIMHLPSEDSGTFNCEICGQFIRKWKSTTSYGYDLKNENKIFYFAESEQEKDRI